MKYYNLTKYHELIYYLIYNKPFHLKHYIKEKEELYNLIIDNTQFLNLKTTFSERLYCYINDITTLQYCPICNSNLLTYKNIKSGYNETCKSCNGKSPNRLKKMKETNIKKYGCSSNLQTEKTKKQIKNTHLKKYGVEHYSQTQEYKEQVIKTNLEKYGVDNPFQSNLIKNKIKDIIKDKYGVDNISKSEEIKEKKIKTSLKNYKVKHPSQSEIVKNKIKNTCLLKYGSNSPLDSKNIIKKIKNNCVIKYGVSHPKKKDINDYKNYNNKKFIEDKFIREGIFYFDEFQNYFNITECTALIKQKELNLSFIRKNYNKSKIQLDIYNEITNLLNNNDVKHSIYYDNKYVISNESSLELDIYIELLDNDDRVIKKIAIEYNGLMYHSFGISKYSKFNTADKEREHKKRHLIKTELCEEKGIKLFHINENEWIDINKQKIWKSMLKNTLKITEKIIYGRKCEIKEVSYKDKNLFMNNNHIQEDASSKINLGLYYENELVSLMTFAKPRYNKNYEWELIRFASSIDTRIIGGASKLLNYFEKNYNPKSLISYGNRKWTYKDTNVYTVLGFRYLYSSNINYYYFNEKNSLKLYHRSVFQKHKLKDKLDIFDSILTETENMYNNGYRKIYDCGQLLFLKEY